MQPAGEARADALTAYNTLAAQPAVVGGAVDLSGLLPAGVQLITNEHWADGQATSLQAALSAARVESLGAVVVGLGDQPLITPPAWRAVAASSAPIAAPQPRRARSCRQPASARTAAARTAAA